MNSSPQSGIQVNRVPALHGWQWLRHGFSLLGMAPRHLLLLMLLMVVITNMLAIFGLIGAVVAKLLVPVMLVGYLMTLRKLAPPGTRLPVRAMPGQPLPTSALRLEDSWSWTQDRRTLFTVIQLGLVSLTIDLAAYFLAGYGAASEVTIQAMRSLPEGQVPDPEQLAAALEPMMRALLGVIAISVPCHVLMWYAPIFAGQDIFALGFDDTIRIHVKVFSNRGDFPLVKKDVPDVFVGRRYDRSFSDQCRAHGTQPLSRSVSHALSPPQCRIRQANGNARFGPFPPAYSFGL